MCSDIQPQNSRLTPHKLHRLVVLGNTDQHAALLGAFCVMSVASMESFEEELRLLPSTVGLPAASPALYLQESPAFFLPL